MAEIVEMRKTESGRRYPRHLRVMRSSSPLLDSIMLDKLKRVELSPSLPAASTGSEIARLHPTGSAPRGDREWVSAGEWRERWSYCRCHAERLEVLMAMDQQLGVQAIDREQVRGTLEWKIRVAKDERASAIVAREVGVSPSRVRQLRMDYVAGRLHRRRTG